MDLRAIQARFYELVTAPEGVARTLAGQGQSARSVEAMVLGDARLSAVDRLDVYANMYFFRLLEVLRDDYSKVVAVVGDDPFHDLVTDYLIARPPAHPSIANAGAALPKFLEGHPLAKERPWLAALATLERTHTELFDGADAESLRLDAIRALPPEALMALTPAPVPCHRILRSAFAVSEVWDAPEAAPAEREESLLVWRQDIEVYHRALDEDEVRLLPMLDGRSSLQGICERWPAATVEEAAQLLFNLLGRLISDEVLYVPVA
jgi:hypothetical protein